MGTKRIPAVIAIALLMGSCASIPKEAPELSQEIGQRLGAMQEVHLTIVNKYFDLKRAEVNQIFENEWIPAYAESFFAQDQVASYWDKLVSEDDRNERLQFLTQLGPRMLEDIRTKRTEFMKPLNTLEKQVEDSLTNEYRQLLSANNTLTSFLSNSSKVSQNRERYLEMFGVQQSTINDYIDQADRRSEQIMETIRNANLN